MTVDHVPSRAGRTEAEWDDHFDGYGDGYDADEEAGYGAPGWDDASYDGPRAQPGDDFLDVDDVIAAWHAERRWSGTRSRASVAALTAAVVVGTGITAGVFGIAPLIHPGGGAPHHTAAPGPANAPFTRTAFRHPAAVQQHTGYVGKHRKPASSQAVPSSPAQPSGVAPSPASGSNSAGTSSPAPGTSQPSHPSPPPSRSPSGGSGSGHHVTHSGSHGLIGGLLGGVTGLVGGVTSAL